MQPDLLHTRRMLTLRYGVFVSAVLIVFSLVVYRQVQRSQALQLRVQVEQLARTAAAELELLHHEHDEMRRSDGPTWLREHGHRALSPQTASQDPQVYLRWFDDELTELKRSGAFRPDGALMPPPPLRDRRQWLPLSDGLALWQPVRQASTQAGRQEPVGYVSVALSSAAAEAELARLREGLSIGVLTAVLLALVASQWMVRASLDPIRRQIQRLIRFSADASHELRHPLTAIRALIGTIRHGGLLADCPPLMDQKLSQIDQSVERMSRLVDELLLLSRSDRAIDDSSGMVDLNLEELIEDLIELHAAEAQAAGLRLQGDLEGSATVLGHPGRLRQLLENLLSNAMRFSPPGGTVRLGLRRQRQQVHVWVDDQGPGIPAALRQEVFERFWQADAARGGPDHLGLGLSIARAIAQAHQGELEAAEAPGGGCRMRLVLPLSR